MTTIRGDYEIAIFVLFCKNPRTPLKLPVPHVKDAAMESDSKQRMISLQDRMETDENSSNREETII